MALRDVHREAYTIMHQMSRLAWDLAVLGDRLTVAQEDVKTPAGAAAIATLSVHVDESSNAYRLRELALMRGHGEARAEVPPIPASMPMMCPPGLATKPLLSFDYVVASIRASLAAAAAASAMGVMSEAVEAIDAVPDTNPEAVGASTI
jgi:hypothetical protein